MPILLHIRDKISAHSRLFIKLHHKIWRKIHGEEEIKPRKGERMFCPPHYMPHKFPFGKKICNEHCHYHNAKWRMLHHRRYCKKLKCPHYKRMMQAYRKREKIED